MEAAHRGFWDTDHGADSWHRIPECGFWWAFTIIPLCTDGGTRLRVEGTIPQPFPAQGGEWAGLPSLKEHQGNGVSFVSEICLPGCALGHITQFFCQLKADHDLVSCC